jgi:hydrogenase maturation protein HypF
MATFQIVIKGIVQGVGFRPFIYNLSRSCHLAGTVKNTSAGVVIQVNTDPEILHAFCQKVRDNAPKLSRIEQLEFQQIPDQPFTDFVILESESRPGDFSLIPPDMAVCDDCLRELFDPADRRYRYPFINCTNCGPRFSIIRKMPYDRPYTSMAGFTMCPACQAEYLDPRDRRFHAQPTACPVCGPQLTYYQDGQLIAEKENALRLARLLLASGGILGLKGLGGFQLICDAANIPAIQRLREGKLRSAKPFALMAVSLDAISQYIDISGKEAEFTAYQRPIIIAPQRTAALAHIAPGQNTLGFMLPYTPLHHLLLESAPDFPAVLVVTSGNISDEPMVTDDQLAFKKMRNIAAGFLSHDRPIVNRVDDSVFQIGTGSYIPIRRARGYAPDPVKVSQPIPGVFAAGALLKNTFSITRDDRVFISQYMGDLDNAETFQAYRESVDHYFDLFQFSPQVIACDLHPDFLSTTFANTLAENYQVELIPVQHHHAHLAACLAENGLPLEETILALAFDGTGYGPDGTIWGGEFLLGNAAGFERPGSLQPLPLPGGDAAIKKPYRIALAYLSALGLLDQAPSLESACSGQEVLLLKTQLAKNLNVFQTTSMGRLFDAVAALIGLRAEVSYEGQAAIELETIADTSTQESYPFDIQAGQIQLKPVFEAILADLRRNTPNPTISARFHNTIVSASSRMIQNIIADRPIQTVALSGGVWQNQLLLRKMHSELQQLGLLTLTHHLTPPNDGCISLGQAVVAGTIMKGR